MKSPISGSWVSNAFVFGMGVFCGVVGYWLYDGAGIWGIGDDIDSSGIRAGGLNAVRQAGELTSTVSSSQGRNVGDGFSQSTLESRFRAALVEGDAAVRSDLLRQAGADGARNDIRSALEVGVEIKRLQDRLDYNRGLFAVWSEIDPEGALVHAKRSFNAGLVQSEMIGLVVNKWAASDPQDARVWTEQNLSGPLRERALTDLMIGWTRRSPDLASNWVTQSGSGSQPLLSAVGTTWAEQDPEAAAAWALRLPYANSRKTATVAVAVEWSRQDPESAADFFVEEAAGPEGMDVATVIADVWGTSDPASTANWVESLPEGAVRDQAAGVLATVWATRDVDAASKWSATIENDSMRQQVIAHLGTTWGALEPDRAIEWLASLPYQEAETGLKGAFNSWGVVDRPGMMDWVESAEASTIVDQARRSLADVVSQDDLLLAIDLSMGISDETARVDAVARYFRHWRKLDDASAQEWLNEVWSEAPAELQERLDQEQKAIVVPRN
jgi:hypothetical protein